MIATARTLARRAAHHRPRLYPKVVVVHPSPNRSTRLVWPPLGVTVHDTEGGNVKGAADLQTLGRVFDPRAGGRADASAGVGTDEEGHSGVYVGARDKAWAQAAYNSPLLSIEQIGFASQNWNARSKRLQLRETARWIAVWHRRYGSFPIQHGHPGGLVNGIGTMRVKGVVQHRELGAAGGGHVDVNASYPMRWMLTRARRYAKMQAAHAKLRPKKAAEIADFHDHALGYQPVGVEWTPPEGNDGELAFTNG